MCGRYSLDARPEEIVEAFELLGRVAVEPRYNIAPTQDAPVVRLDPETGARRLDLIRWGLSPGWWKGPRPLINARAESVATRPVFRRAFHERRCLVPATGFYEWQKLDSAKQPFHIGLRGGGLFAFAGIWDLARDADGGQLASFAILTTAPNALCAPIHDRMPLILPPEQYAAWLRTGEGAPEGIDGLPAPVAAERMHAHPVSTLVNSADNDEPACTRPLDAGGAAERQGGFEW